MIQKINDYISVYFTDEGFGRSNSILIDDNTRVMIDSGAGKILELADPLKIDILLNSHCHIDHVWDNDIFVNSPILAHPLEKENFKDVRKIGSFDSWDLHMDEDLDGYIKIMTGMKPSLLGEWRIDGTIDEGETIDAGRTRIVAMHTPGHTSGHLSFFFPDTGLLFCADICLTKVGPWYGDSVTPVDDFISSIDRIIAMKPDIVVTGHNRGVLEKGITEAFEEYRDRIFRRDDRVLAAVRERPSTVNELADKILIYPAHPSIFVKYWEKTMIVKHLERLAKKGVVSEGVDGIYYSI